MSLTTFVTQRAGRALLLSVVLGVAPFAAQAGPYGVDAAAGERLKASMDYLAGLEAFELETHSTIEIVLIDGQKLQYDHDTRVAVQRPDRLYAERLGELVNQEFFYDGDSLTLHQENAGVYATVPAPDTLEGMLDFARESLDIVAPAGDFIDRNAYAILMDGVNSAFVVGTAFVEGTVCDHLAFSKPGTDFQVWIEQGDRPLPRKLVITTRDVVNAPQFTVNIRRWNVEPRFSAGLFRFDAPADAMSIEFDMPRAEAD